MNSRNRQTKPVFAAYLNMARQNAYVTLLHISKLMGIDERKATETGMYNFGIIKELGKRKGEVKSERILKIIKLLHKHFPFVNAMIDMELRRKSYYEPTELEDCTQEEKQSEMQNIALASPVTYYTIFEIIFKLMDSLRNEYTHYSPICDETDKANVQKAIVPHLYNCLDGGRRVVKNRFADIDEKDLRFLTDMPRYNYETVIDGNKHLKKATERSDFHYRLRTNEGTLSDMGIVLFICLFLHKKYTTQFLSQIKDFFPKKCSEKEKKVIREIFSVYRVRLPRERMESQRSDYALGMDMLNELQKCPKELYETLSDDKKSEFHIKSSYDETGNETDEGEVLLMRHNDRFPYFALRYIDECLSFKDIRFQVSLGNYRYKFYEKQCIDTTDSNRVRSLQKEINGFGRLSEIEQRRKETWKEHIRTNDKVRKDETVTLPYITDHHASYVFNGNRIGLLFNTQERHDLQKKDKEAFYLPPLTFDPGQEGKDAVCVSPMCWLSIYELPAMIFHQYLSKDDSTERIIKETVARYHKLFTDIQEGRLSAPVIFPGWKNDRKFVGKKKNRRLSEEAKVQLETFLYENYRIHTKDIPEKLIEYLTSMFPNVDGCFRKKVLKRIDKMINGTKVRLEKFKKERKLVGKKDNKFGKKRYVDIRPGRLAAYLAKDMLFFQPVNETNTNKVTGLNYQVLQASLAIYDKSISDLRKLFVKANLLDNNMSHPFLQKVLNKRPGNTLDFYLYYLQAKIGYLSFPDLG